MIGLCSTHPNPDMWFPEDLPSQRGSGRPSKAQNKLMVEKALKALAICNYCPVREQCLAEGMREDNIEHGIWGGMLAGDRIALSQSNRTSTVREQAITFARGVRAWRNI